MNIVLLKMVVSIFKVDDKELIFVFSVLPTVFGEKIVMRLLRKSGGLPTFNELGLTGIH
jgi:type IV pilus assembly protein PilB